MEQDPIGSWQVLGYVVLAQHNTVLHVYHICPFCIWHHMFFLLKIPSCDWPCDIHATLTDLAKTAWISSEGIIQPQQGNTYKIHWYFMEHIKLTWWNMENNVWSVSRSTLGYRRSLYDYGILMMLWGVMIAITGLRGQMFGHCLNHESLWMNKCRSGYGWLWVKHSAYMEEKINSMR